MIQPDGATGMDFNIVRSGSAPPTFEGSFRSFNGLFEGDDWQTSNKLIDCGILSEDKIRADPAYASYYHSNSYTNPSLPPPLSTKEDWRAAPRLHSGVKYHVIGDSGNDDGWHKSLFSVQPGRYRSDIESENEVHKPLEPRRDEHDDWDRKLDNQKDQVIATAISDHALRSTIKHTFDANGFTPEMEIAQLQYLRSATNNQRGAYASMGPSIRSHPPLSRASSSRYFRIEKSLNQKQLAASNSCKGTKFNLYGGSDLISTLSNMNLQGKVMSDPEKYAMVPRNEIDEHNVTELCGENNYLSLHSASNMPISAANPCLNGLSSVSMTRICSNHPCNDVSKSMSKNYCVSDSSIHSSRTSSANQFFGRYPHSFIESCGISLGNVFDSVDSYRSGFMGTSSELEHRENGNASELSWLDPIYPQLLKSNYSVPLQHSFYNDMFMSGEYPHTQYFNGLQNAYLGSVHPSDSSLCHVSTNSKSAFELSSPDSLHGSGSSLLSSLNGPCVPMRHGEHSKDIPFGIRNSSNCFVRHWHPEGTNYLAMSYLPSLLEDFKSNKLKNFDLAKISGQVVVFSSDQYGSRLIQQKLETATEDEKNMIFVEIMPHALSLMTDVFGNYVIQKFFELGSALQIRELVRQLRGHVLTLSLQMYGCRVIQKAIEAVELDQKISMVTELSGHVVRCVRDQNGNHVIQKCIECIPEEEIDFIVSTFYNQVVSFSTHPYGCRVIQRVLEHCRDCRTQQRIMDEILQSVTLLSQDQYGNYVVQHVLEHGKASERSAIIKNFLGQIVQMSQQKFASNVIEKCLTYGTKSEFQTLVNEMIGCNAGNESLQVMMKDQFANYVVQKVLEICDDQQLELILNRIKVQLNALKKYTYGKHIVSRVEKLVAAGERRITILSHQPTS